MSVPKDHRLTMRCPVCFGRDVDVLMKLEGGKYSCLKCSFTGDEAEVRSFYRDIQRKFRNIAKRITLEDYHRL